MGYNLNKLDRAVTNYHCSKVENYDILICFMAVDKQLYRAKPKEAYFIEVCCGNADYINNKMISYRVSMFEPTYIYGDQKIPERYKHDIVEVIKEEYKTAAKYIMRNIKTSRKWLLPMMNNMPDYDMLETEPDSEDTPHFEYHYNRKDIELAFDDLENTECDFYVHYPDNISAHGCFVGYWPPYRNCYPETEEIYYIRICIRHEGKGGSFSTYRISFKEPKYLFFCDPLPSKYKDSIVKAIEEHYREGIQTLVELGYCSEKEPLDPNMPMPDYSLLETTDEPDIDKPLYYTQELLRWDDLCDRIYVYRIPDYYIRLKYSTIDKYIRKPTEKEDFYIHVSVGRQYTSNCDHNHMISLEKPEVLWDSEMLPEEYHDVVIKAIFDTYNDGLKAINKYVGKELFSLDDPIPDYNKLGVEPPRRHGGYYPTDFSFVHVGNLTDNRKLDVFMC